MLRSACRACHCLTTVITASATSSGMCDSFVHSGDAEAGRWQDVLLHPLGSYTYQDLLLAAAILRMHLTALHQEVGPRDRLACPWLLLIIAVRLALGACSV
jgi:hypothetical protein